MRNKGFLAIAGTLSILAGCSGDNVALQSYYNYPAYDYANFSLYHAGRDTRVIVHGNPFGMDRTAFAKAVTDAMQGANIGRPTRFTTTPGPSAEKNLWVVMAFNTGNTIYGLCGPRDYPSEQGGRGSEGLLLRAAWCFDGRQDSWVEARISGARGTGDPRFRALVRQTVLNLFVPQRRFRDRNDRRRRGLRLHL